MTAGPDLSRAHDGRRYLSLAESALMLKREPHRHEKLGAQ